MENRIATSIEQSNKLIELGIDITTADMYWWYSGKRYYVESMDDDDFNKESDIPAWSLTALLELIPKEQHPELMLNAHYKWICEIYNPFSFAYEPTAGDNPIDAVFEMILKLHKLNLM